MSLTLELLEFNTAVIVAVRRELLLTVRITVVQSTALPRLHLPLFVC